jgi:hypothetical protein
MAQNADGKGMRRTWQTKGDSPQTWNVVALVKGHERFVFVYDEMSQEMLIDEIRYRAADPNSPINWQDAFLLTQRIRQASEDVPSHHPFSSSCSDESFRFDSPENA